MNSISTISNPPHQTNVCGVSILFNPGETLAKNVEGLSSQTSYVILVDNGSNEHVFERIEQLSNKHVELICNERNLGIAAALNQGLERAIKLGYSWAITFDQDSRPASDLIKQLCDAYSKVSDPERVAILAPKIINLDVEKSTYYLRPRFGPIYERTRCDTGILESVSTVITSGSMINLRIFQELGGYREDFFMDYVDTEYCLRACSKGYKIVVACDASLDHILGDRREVRVGKLRLYPTFHPPQRWYTINRNRIVMIRTYALRFPHWFAYELVAFWYTLVRMLLTEDRRLEKLRAIWRGLLDGLHGRMGEGA